MNAHSRVRPDIVQAASTMLSSGFAGTELISRLKGVHPIELKAELGLRGATDLSSAIFSGIGVQRSLFHELSREDNPVLHFWPFSSKTSAHLADIARGFGAVALLGAPSVFMRLQNEGHQDVCLFERDEYFFRERDAPGFVKCDIEQGVPKQFHGLFDIVIGDPPWYLREYRRWLDAAEQLVRPGGTVAFVLFPEWVRDSAPQERSALVELFRSRLSHLSIGEAAVEYQTPSFEQVQLILNGIKPICWRRADLIVGQTSDAPTGLFREPEAPTDRNWAERRVGCGRLFIDLGESGRAERFLEQAAPASRFLRSPSRRASGRKRANVISSRGHGLYCRSPELLLSIIDGLSDPIDLAHADLALEEDSGLFSQLVSDLWARSIRLHPNFDWSER
jgi:hypothetical protein